MVQHAAVPADQLVQRPGPLRQGLLLRHPLPLHRAAASPRDCGRTPTTTAATRRWSTPSASPTSPGWRPRITQLDPSGPPVAERHHQDPGSLWSLPGMSKEVNTYFLVTAVLLRRLRAAGDLVPGRGASAATVGRAAVRALPGAADDRPDQLGPAGGRARRRRAVGLGARPAGADRRDDRPGHRRQALPAVPARARSWSSPGGVDGSAAFAAAAGAAAVAWRWSTCRPG